MCGVSLLAATAFSSASTAASDYPARPIRIVVSQQAGGGTDTIARLWAESVGKTLGTSVVVENRPGAGGSIAAQSVLSQPADGYTLFLAGVSQMVLNKFVYKPLAYSPENDFVGIGMLTTVPFALVANPKTGLKTLDDLRAASKAKPDHLTFASSGNGNSTHLVVEMLMKQTGMKLMHIPFKGEPDGLVSTIGGTTDLMAPVVGSALPLIKQGKLTALLVFSDSRLPDLPNVPTAKEAGLTGFENIGWSAIAAKKGTPSEAIEKLNHATQIFLADPTVVKKLSEAQVQPMPGPASALQQMIVQDTKKWEEAIGDLNLAVN
ncbi:Bug family tripartite tricarboxylate transporter substrate binding protein [Achromobacter spanius]|uniref:Bug family tripartite tricarboxylate transporter substrate binding protein n=1 Tax=Achromobacter spanius TaxID=217203 RepID=UPI003829D65D